VAKICLLSNAGATLCTDRIATPGPCNQRLVPDDRKVDDALFQRSDHVAAIAHLLLEIRERFARMHHLSGRDMLAGADHAQRHMPCFSHVQRSDLAQSQLRAERNSDGGHGFAPLA
jgi:hypothetical protein